LHRVGGSQGQVARGALAGNDLESERDSLPIEFAGQARA
jgi:hypothetical protein